MRARKRKEERREMGRRLTLHLTRSHSNWFKTKRDIDYKVTRVFYGLPKRAAKD